MVSAEKNIFLCEIPYILLQTAYLHWSALNWQNIREYGFTSTVREKILPHRGR